MSKVAEVKERPILFSGPMVRAILDGRKTATRRVIKPQPTNGIWWEPEWPNSWVSSPLDKVRFVWSCPYGVPGDRLWVRETCWIDRAPVSPGEPLRAFFADGWCVFSDGRPGGHSPFKMTEARLESNAALRKTSSIHMPRWASRITLEVVSVRVERLQEISEDDAIAEGVEPMRAGQGGEGPIKTYRTGLVHAWDAINGSKHPWASNPWVWVIEFRRIEA